MTDAHSALPTDGTLLPCPFCGVAPEVTIEDVHKSDTYWELGYTHACENGTYVTLTKAADTKEKCFSEFCKKWNTRYTPKDLAGSFAKRGAGDILAKFTLRPLDNIPGNGKD